MGKESKLAAVNVCLNSRRRCFVTSRINNQKGTLISNIDIKGYLDE